MILRLIDLRRLVLPDVKRLIDDGRAPPDRSMLSLNGATGLPAGGVVDAFCTSRNCS